MRGDDAHHETIRARRSLIASPVTIAKPASASAVTPGKSASPWKNGRLHRLKWRVPAAESR